ncbi:MAG: NUDIX domain-containing protein [Spirochaetota bacterium]
MRREPDSVDRFVFNFCPGCGLEGIRSENRRRWHCDSCGFEYFHNVATAAGLIIETGAGILLFERAREPAKGRLGLPGGFVEPGESAEEALVRECREEIGWAPASMDFVASFPNTYPWKDVPYRTCDLYFACSALDFDISALVLDSGEISAVVAADAIPWNKLAFPSLHRALAAYLGKDFLRRGSRP